MTLSRVEALSLDRRVRGHDKEAVHNSASRRADSLTFFTLIPRQRANGLVELVVLQAARAGEAEDFRGGGFVQSLSIPSVRVLL
jgi:hypothetical protein